MTLHWTERAQDDLAAIHAFIEADSTQAKELRQRVDVVWRLLLQSAATMGNSRGWKGLFGAFDAVGAIRQDLRVSYMEPILQTASVRMPRCPQCTAVVP